MTINDAINHVDEIQPNAYSNGVKIRWLNQLMGQIGADIWLCDPVDIAEFGSSDGSCNLPKLPSGYDDIWESHLKAQIHRTNEEDGLAATAFSDFNDLWGAYLRYFSQRYEPAYNNIRRRVRCKLDGISTSGPLFKLPPYCMVTGIVLDCGNTSDCTVTLYGRRSSDTVGKAVSLDTTGETDIPGAIISGGDCVDVGIIVSGTVSKATLELSLYYAGDDWMKETDSEFVSRTEISEIEAALIEFGRRAMR